MTDYKGKILVVDDDPTLLHILVDTLTALGYQTVSAEDGIAALDMLQSEYGDSFDLMITDIRMPNMDGVTLLKRVRRYYPAMPVLFISGAATENMIMEASPDGYLSKPFRISRLEDLIEKAIAGRHGNPNRFQSRKVLLTIHEPGLRQKLTDTLNASHYLPFAVSDSDQALQELENGRFDIVITGVEKSTSKGAVAANRIRQQHPGLPMLAVSSSYTPDELNNLRDTLNVDGFVQKPFNLNDLVDQLDDTVGPSPNTI